MVTRLFTYAGTKLLLNVSTSGGGSARVELQDAAGKVLEASHGIVGDAADYEVQWPGLRDLSAHAGKPVRLRVELKDADLFALRFA